MKYLDPKADFTFKKIFGNHPRRYPKSCKSESRIAGFVSLAFAQRANRVFSW